ncbi:hypothetical protein BH09BAC6_BH09BAC6_07800 [soil metagenome]
MGLSHILSIALLAICVILMAAHFIDVKSSHKRND